MLAHLVIRPLKLLEAEAQIPKSLAVFSPYSTPVCYRLSILNREKEAGGIE